MTILVALLLLQAPAVSTQPPASPQPAVLTTEIPAVSFDTTRQQIACAPMTLPAPPIQSLHVLGGNVHGRIMFGPGDPVVIDAGSAQGIQNGQRYFVRRYLRDKFTPASADFTPYPVHTAGWVTIIETRETMAVATVTHACDGIVIGDYLEPYVDPVIPPAAFGGDADFDHPGRLVMSDEKRQSGATGTLMLMNRGSDHGVRAGQTVTIYREAHNAGIYEQMVGAAAYSKSMYAAPAKNAKTKGAAHQEKPADNGPISDVGRGTVLSVQPQTSLIRIDSSRDAVYLGDLVAIHRIAQ